MSQLSIIIPIYNSAKNGLRKCLDSVVSQTYFDFELILVNDGSTDNSLDICKSFAKTDNRIIIIDQLNSGVSHARNNGLMRASGKFITFVDSDDAIPADYLHKLMQHADDYDLVVCGVRQSFANGEVKVFDTPCKDAENITSDSLHSLIQSRLAFGPCNKIFRNSIIQKHSLSFPEDIDYGEDRIFVYNYLKLINNYK